MLGFKRFETVAITISGIGLAEKIRKRQFKTGKLPRRPKAAPEIWASILPGPTSVFSRLGSPRYSLHQSRVFSQHTHAAARNPSI